MRGVPNASTIEDKAERLADLFGADRYEWGIDDSTETIYIEFWGIKNASSPLNDGHYRADFTTKTQLLFYLADKIRLMRCG